jgi:uncharacterized protein YggU (UPF0235/DUF167 family)
MVAVRVKPAASRARVGGCWVGPYGPALVVAVTARAVEGRATAAVLAALADALGVRPRAISVRAGGTSRDKLLAVEAEQPIGARVVALRNG